MLQLSNFVLWNSLRKAPFQHDCALEQKATSSQKCPYFLVEDDDGDGGINFKVCNSLSMISCEHVQTHFVCKCLLNIQHETIASNELLQITLIPDDS